MSAEKVHADVQPDEALASHYPAGKAAGYATSSGSHESEEESVDLYQTSDERRQIGLVSAVFLYVTSPLYFLRLLITNALFRIFNRMVGTGVFSTPSSILALSGSVGLALFIWVAGMLIADWSVLSSDDWFGCKLQLTQTYCNSDRPRHMSASQSQSDKPGFPGPG